MFPPRFPYNKNWTSISIAFNCCLMLIEAREINCYSISIVVRHKCKDFSRFSSINVRAPCLWQVVPMFSVPMR
jgi:hypothetical protein